MTERLYKLITSQSNFPSCIYTDDSMIWSNNQWADQGITLNRDKLISDQLRPIPGLYLFVITKQETLCFILNIYLNSSTTGILIIQPESLSSLAETSFDILSELCHGCVLGIDDNIIRASSALKAISYQYIKKKIEATENSYFIGRISGDKSYDCIVATCSHQDKNYWICLPDWPSQINIFEINQLLTDNINAVIITDSRGTIVSYNEKFQQLFYSDSCDLSGRPFYEIIRFISSVNSDLQLPLLDMDLMQDEQRTIKVLVNGKIFLVNIQSVPISGNYTAHIMAKAGTSSVMNTVYSDKKPILESLLEKCSGAIFRAEWKDELKYNYLSDNISEVTDISIEEFYKANPLDLLTIKEDQSIRDSIYDSIKYKSDYQVEYRISKPGGKITWLRENGFIIPGGPHLCIVGAIFNITALKTLEEDFELAKSKYERLTNNSPEIIFSYDIKKKNYTFLSSATLAITGWEPAKFYADPALFLSIVLPDWREYYAGEIAKVINTGKNRNFEFKIIDKSGITKWLYMKSTLDHDISNNHSNLEGIISDITEQKWAIKELAKSEKKYRQLYKNMREGLLIIAPDGRFLQSNQAFCDIIGFSEAELLQKTYHDLLADIDKYLISDELIQQLYTIGYTDKHIRKLKRKDGQIISVETAVYIMTDDNNRTSSFFSIIRDITKQLQIEEDLRVLNKTLEQKVAIRTSDLKKLNKELGDFAYIVSHDLKAPLRGIHQLASWISDDYSTALDDEGKEMLTLMQGRVDKMNRLIDGILEYSRVGRMETLPQTVDLNEIIEEVTELIDFPEKVNLIIKSELPVLYANKIRILQLFQNLISNAIKYNDKDEIIIVIEHKDTQKYWEFSIEDNGPGIEPKYHEKVFGIFQTLNQSDSSNSTGIGLTIVRKVLGLYGGDININSEPGKGAKFIFKIAKDKVTLA